MVSEELWRHRWIIDDFANTNPLGVARDHLEVARPWRHAVHDAFTCIDANEDYALYINDHRAFAVGAMRGNADAHVHDIPSLMLLTLLPFKGGVVTDGKTVHLSRRPIPSALGLIARQGRWEVPHGARAAPHGHARPSLPLASAGKTGQAVAENERMPVRPG